MTLETIEKAALQKGIHLLSLADFTHPMWFREITEKVEEIEEGIYQLKAQDVKRFAQGDRRIKFLVTTEISCIYKQANKLRRIHVIVCLSSLEKAGKLNHELAKRGANLSADGRPIIGLSAKSLLTLCLEIDENAMVIPAHIWTPHFGVYGSASGFDSLQECFEDLAPYIYGIETGISSDPEMNWQIPELESRSILSFSDAHSLPKMAREATVLSLEGRELQETEGTFSYADIKEAIMAPMTKSIKSISGIKGIKGFERTMASDTFDTPDTSKVAYTIEFYPEEGKYHFSGHRKCKISYGLEDVRTHGTTCPVCGKRLTEGVYIRLQQLAPQFDTSRVVKQVDVHEMTWYRDRLGKNPPYVKLIPLKEIIAESIGVGVGSKKVDEVFNQMIGTLGTELEILMEINIQEIENLVGERIAEGVLKSRKGELSIIPGFDGEYGKVSLWENEEQKTPQLSMEF